MSERLIVFTHGTRIPVTLRPGLSRCSRPEERLHNCINGLPLRTALVGEHNTLAEMRPLHLEVYFNGGTVDSMCATFGQGLAYMPQVEGDLGAWLIAATDMVDGPTVVIGTRLSRSRS